MGALLNLARWLVYSNIFIALCAVAMSWLSLHLFNLQAPATLLPFIFFASIASYSFHWYLSTDLSDNSPRLRWMARYRWVHFYLLIAGMAGSVYYGIALLPWWPWLACAAIFTFLYSAPKIPHPVFRQLRRVAVGKTIFLALMWTFVTTTLPLVISDTGWQAGYSLFLGSRFFLIYAICILFDYRDRAYDRSIGIRSLITWMNDRQIGWLFAISIIICAACTLGLLQEGVSMENVILLLIPGLLTALSYRLALRNFDDMLYYAWLDGLMALSAILIGLRCLMNC